jgi:hypothetical protein
MKSEGKGSLSLFNIQSDVEKELRVLSAERIFEKLGLEKPKTQKKVGSFDMPLIPKQEDFFLFPFRHLSETVVGAGTYKATDFSKDGVLKRGTKLLTGRPAYLNHVQLVGQEIGVVGDTEWVNAYKNSKGVNVPGGIEAPFVIDSVLNADLVRKLSSPVSPIDSCSVTVVFEWEASHEFEHDNDFWWHLGQIIKDDEGEEAMVRRIVTKILSFEESSLVWMGADPYAKILSNNGEVINIDRAAAYAKNKFSTDPDNAKWDTNRRLFVFDCLDKDFILHLSKSIPEPERPKPEKYINMDKDLLEFLASHFKTSVDKIQNGQFKKADAEKFSVVDAAGFAKMKSGEEFDTVSKDKTTAETRVTELTSEVATLKKAKGDLETEVTTSKTFVELGKNTLKAAKDEAKRVYGILAKGKEDKTITDELEAETSIEKLNAKIKLFGGQVVGEFGGTCGKCGSKDISFRSSVPTEGGDPGKGRKEADSEVNLAEHFRS